MFAYKVSIRIFFELNKKILFVIMLDQKKNASKEYHYLIKYRQIDKNVKYVIDQKNINPIHKKNTNNL